MEKKITWGILGPGIIAHEFVQDFRHVNNAVVGAVASRSLDRSKDFAAQYDIPRWYGRYEEIYSDPTIDAIYIATPHNFHLAQSSDALSAGKAVLCEKPITISTNELQQLLEMSKQKELYLAEGMWTYFLPAILKAKEWIDAGRIGEVLHVKADFGYPVPFDAGSRYYNPDLAGGSLYDMGIYPIAMAQLFIGKKHQGLMVKSIPSKTGVTLTPLSTWTMEKKPLTCNLLFVANYTTMLTSSGRKDTLTCQTFGELENVTCMSTNK